METLKRTLAKPLFSRMTNPWPLTKIVRKIRQPLSGGNKTGKPAWPVGILKCALEGGLLVVEGPKVGDLKIEEILS